MTQYEHSQAFSSLKGVTETIQGNLTSPQYLTALDAALERAYTPILLSTSCIDPFLGQVIGWQEVTRKRKVSFVKREEFIPIALMWLALPRRDLKALFFSALKLDRAICAEFVNSFLLSMVDYEKAASGMLTDSEGRRLPSATQEAYIREVEASAEASGSLLGVVREARTWLGHYYSLQKAVLEKYYRVCLTTARRDYEHTFNYRIRLSDIVQMYNLAMVRAVDKCDPRQGVLTTHIKFWLYSARGVLLREKVNQDATSPLVENDGEETDTPDPNLVPLLDQLEGVDTSSHLLEIARLVDPEGYGRAYLGLTESPEWILEEIEKLAC